MSDAMNNPYANNPNQNGSNGQQPQGQPETASADGQAGQEDVVDAEFSEVDEENKG